MDSVAADDFNQAARDAAGSMKVSSGREPPPHNQVEKGDASEQTKAESEAARKKAKRLRVNERRRERRAEARIKQLQDRMIKAREEKRVTSAAAAAASAAAAAAAHAGGEKGSPRNQGDPELSYYRVPIVGPGVGLPQGQHHRGCTPPDGVTKGSGARLPPATTVPPASQSVVSRAAEGAGAPAAKDGFDQAGGSLVPIASVRAGSGSGTSGSSSAGAGFGSGFGRSSGPMDSAAIRALLADPTKLTILMSNLLSERRKEVDLAKRKRDSLLEQKKRLEGDRAKAQQRHKAGMERRRQPPLPVDDALLHTLKALPPSKEGDVSAVAGDAPGGTDVGAPPRALKKLSISAAIAGPLLRAWDFLHSMSQVITLSPFGLDDFADSLHYGGGPSVMVVEVHTRLLSVILRDGKFPKSLREAIGAGTGSVDASSSGGGSVGASGKQTLRHSGVASPGAGTGTGVSKKGKGSAGRAYLHQYHRHRAMGLRGLGRGSQGEDEENIEGEEEEEREDLLACLLPPRSERNEHHDNANNLVTPLTWQTVLALALPRMGPYARAVAPLTPDVAAAAAAAAPAGTHRSGRGSELSVLAAERVEEERIANGRALMRARRNLMETEYSSLSLEEKALLLEVLIDTAYETKRIRSVLDENMRERMSLESQRREDIIAYNRELREKATAQKAKAQARLRKANEAQYRRRMVESEKAAKERARKATEMETEASQGVPNGAGGGASAAASASASAGGTAADGGSGGKSGNPHGMVQGARGAADGAAGGGHSGGGSVASDSGLAGAKGKGKGKKGKGKAVVAEEGNEAEFGLPKMNIKVYEPDRAQLQAGIAEDTVKEECGGEFRVKTIVVPMEDVDPTEVEEEEEDRAAKKIMLENLSRQELIRRRREMDAKEKDRARRRRDWKESRLHRLQQNRALNSLKAAVGKGDLHVLQEALKDAKKASLEGEDENGLRFICPEVRDAYLALAAAKERMRRTEILEKYRKLMAEKFVRTEPLGTDRHGNRYWMFNGDSRIHVETISRKQDAPSPKASKVKATKNSAGSAIGAEDMIIVEEERDARVRAAANGNLSEISSNGNATSGVAVAKRKGKARAQGDYHNGVNEATELLTKRPTHQPAEFYHPVWSQSAWMYYDSDEEFIKLILRLDPRGKREGELRQVLQECFDVAELERSTKERSNRASSSKNSKNRLAWLEGGSNFLGKRLRRVFGRRVTGAVILKWVPEESNNGMALWHVRHDDGDEEDLEEHEVKEGLAMAEAEEQQGSSPGTEMSALVRGAMDRSLTKTFSEYVNRLNKMQAIKPRDLGLFALKETLLHREAGMLDDIKERSSGYSKGTNSATPRGAWLRLVREATDISDIREAILKLEETLRGLQAGEDKIEGGRMEMEAKGWNFDPDGHPFIGRRCRRFFKEYGKSNCTVVAYLPPKNNDPELWHVLHDDGDAEDVEAHELEKAARYYEDGIEEQPHSADEDHDHDESHEDGSRDGEGPGRTADNDDNGDNDDNEDNEEEEDDDEDVEDQKAFAPSPTKHRATLWENWGARQGWIKAIKAASTVATLALGFLTLVETTFLFGIGKESMLEANRSRARMAKAWETPGTLGKPSGKRAAAVAASVAISTFAEMDAEGSESSSTTAGAGAGVGGGGSGGSGKRRSSREGGGSSLGVSSGGDSSNLSKASSKRQRR